MSNTLEKNLLCWFHCEGGGDYVSVNVVWLLCFFMSKPNTRPKQIRRSLELQQLVDISAVVANQHEACGGLWQPLQCGSWQLWMA